MAHPGDDSEEATRFGNDPSPRVPLECRRTGNAFYPRSTGAPRTRTRWRLYGQVDSPEHVEEWFGLLSHTEVLTNRGTHSDDVAPIEDVAWHTAGT
jgi:hypothetical protein